MSKVLAVLGLVALVVGVPFAARAYAETVPEDVYRAYAQGDYAAAEKAITTALAAATSADAKIGLSIELGDLYLDKLRRFHAAESIYSGVVDQYPEAKEIADVVYRLGIAYERQEKYLDAAQAYEKVAIKYQGSTYAEDALNAIERCFSKNYQDRAAYVDSFPITRLEFDNRISQSPAQYEKWEEKQKLINQMVDDRLLYAEALRQKLDQAPDFRKQMSDYRRDQMMQTWYDREVVKKVVVPESAKRNYFKERRNDYITPEQVRAREIQVKTRPMADSLRRLVVEGKVAFETLAKANSQAPDKDRGGDMGFFRRDTRAKEIDAVAFGMKVGEVSQVIKTGDSSFVILRLEEKRERKERSYDDAASEIENRLKPQETQARLNALLESAKKLQVVMDTTALASNRDTLAVVNGLPVLVADLNVMIERIPPMYRAQFESPEGKKRVLDQLITEKIVMRQAEQSKYWLLSDIVGAMLDREHQLLTQTIKKQNTTEKVTVDSAAVKKEYERTIKDYRVAEQVRAREIVFRNEDDAIFTREQLMDRENPVSFDSLARSVSTAPTRWAAGDMGAITRGQKPKQIEKVLFSLKPKALSRVIKVNDSTWTILRVDEHKAAYNRPLSEVRPKIERKLRQDEEKRLTESYLAELRKKAQVYILLTEENTRPPALDTLAPLPGDTSGLPIEIGSAAELPPEIVGSVYFDIGASSLRPDARKTLDSLVGVLKPQTSLKLIVSGYADSSATVDVNKTLAAKRAKAVQQYFEKAGVEAGRIEQTVEVGAEKRAKDEQWRDRRVDVLIK